MIQKPSFRTKYLLTEPLVVEMRMSMTGSEPSIVKTTCPEPLTVPTVNAEPSFVAVYWLPAVFPPMVNVIVVPPMLDVCVHLNSVSAVQTVSTEIVVFAEELLLDTEKAVAVTAPSETAPPVDTLSELNCTLNPVLTSVVLLTESLTTNAPLAVRPCPPRVNVRGDPLDDWKAMLLKATAPT